MRGSPLIRTFLILAALIVSGIGFARLTQKGVTVTDGQEVEITDTQETDRIPAKVYITLSASAEKIDLQSGEEKAQLKYGGAEGYIGNVQINPKNPVIFLKVSSTSPNMDGGYRFAKIVVEAEGKETFTHIFDADGDIDDFVELPF